MARHLLMRLEAPLIAFGGEAIDNLGIIREFPALSMITGLLANALGWRREEGERHNDLQTRLRIGARLERSGERLTDFQTAQLGAQDKAWTTWGTPEARRGGAGTYSGPHLRYREYHADLAMLVVLRLEPANPSPTLEELAAALDRPARPLFVGRKPCLPTDRIFAGWLEANNILHALQTATPIPSNLDMPMQWPDGEGEMRGAHRLDICDERNWSSGVHGGWRSVFEGSLHQRESS